MNRRSFFKWLGALGLSPVAAKVPGVASVAAATGAQALIEISTDGKTWTDISGYTTKLNISQELLDDCIISENLFPKIELGEWFE